ncbi:hypothetical protein bAD24_p00930 (plasmid) [Burkholderia sp. AD24]|nr:hypothetical protein bAD24_p00930 [Burkholderia sp. AD24]
MKNSNQNRRQRSDIAHKVLRGPRIVTLHAKSALPALKALRRTLKPGRAVVRGSGVEYHALRLSDAEVAAVRSFEPVLVTIGQRV